MNWKRWAWVVAWRRDQLVGLLEADLQQQLAYMQPEQLADRYGVPRWSVEWDELRREDRLIREDIESTLSQARQAATWADLDVVRQMIDGRGQAFDVRV